MSELRKKRISKSQTEQVQIVMSGDINGNGRLFGGRLVEWIDVVAAVVAKRHSGCEVTTVSIENLHFKAAAYANDTVVLIGCVTHVGRTSMEVRVDAYAENLRGKRSMINRAYVVMVALDENEKPAPVPGLILETDEQRSEWAAGEKRRELNKNRRTETHWVKKGKEGTNMKYECVCGYIYDEAIGDPDNDIAPGTKWDDLPDNWSCPVCGAGKDLFSEV